MRAAAMAWSKTPLRPAGEAAGLALLLRERLDDAHADDVLLGVRGDVGDALLHVLQHRVDVRE